MEILTFLILVITVITAGILIRFASSFNSAGKFSLDIEDACSSSCLHNCANCKVMINNNNSFRMWYKVSNPSDYPVYMWVVPEINICRRHGYAHDRKLVRKVFIKQQGCYTGHKPFPLPVRTGDNPFGNIQLSEILKNYIPHKNLRTYLKDFNRMIELKFTTYCYPPFLSWLLKPIRERWLVYSLLGIKMEYKWILRWDDELTNSKVIYYLDLD